MIAASMRTFVIAGSVDALEFAHGFAPRLTLWPTRTKLLAISPSVASEPSTSVMSELVAGAVVLDVEHAVGRPRDGVGRGGDARRVVVADVHRGAVEVHDRLAGVGLAAGLGHGLQLRVALRQGQLLDAGRELVVVGRVDGRRLVAAAVLDVARRAARDLDHVGAHGRAADGLVAPEAGGTTDVDALVVGVHGPVLRVSVMGGASVRARAAGADAYRALPRSAHLAWIVARVVGEAIAAGSLVS